MRLSGPQISSNYQQAYSLAVELLQQLLQQRGYARLESYDEEEICQSALGDISIVTLLTEKVFTPDRYRAPLIEAIEDARRMLFPDVAKRRFTSIDKLEFVLEAESVIDTAADSHKSDDEFQTQLFEKLPQEDAAFLQQVLLKHQPDWWRSLKRISKKNTLSTVMLDKAIHTISLLRRYYPDGILPDVASYDGRQSLSDDEIRHAYLLCYLGVERRLPQHLFAKEADHRGSVLVRFLVEDILEKSPEAVLEEADEVFFLKHKLQSLYRHFNYSANRVLRNTWPDRIHPWINSRCESDFWANPAHRIQAIRWLIEERLDIIPEMLYRVPLKRKDFSANGLSYLFNTFYNSASRAISEAYPNLRPWQIGKIPADVWTDETAAEAIRWMMLEKGWLVDEIPQRVQIGELNRKTFSEFGLATLFEKRFGKNLFRAIDAGWPGRFEIWEIGNVPRTYWEDQANIYRASSWIADREGFDEKEIVSAVRQKELVWQKLQKYSIGNALKKLSSGRLERLFAPLFVKEMQLEQEKSKNLRKARQLATVGDRKSWLNGLVFFELFGTRHRQNTKYRQLISRMSRRRYE